MKEFVDIHDFLVDASIVGDWDGEEDLVAEKVNAFYHTMYDMADENIEPAILEAILHRIWDIWIGDDALPDIEYDDIQDWCKNVLDNQEQFLQQD